MVFETKSRQVNDLMIYYVEVPIKYQGRDEIVEVKKLTYGEFLDLQNDCSRITYLGQQPKYELDQRAMAQSSLLRSIVKAPFKIDIQGVRNLDVETGRALLEAFHFLNEASDKKKMSSPEPSETEQATPETASSSTSS